MNAWKKAGQIIGTFCLTVLCLGLIILAGYGTYALIDRYALPKDNTPKQEEKEPEQDNTVTTTAEYQLAEQSLAEYVA